MKFLLYLWKKKWVLLASGLVFSVLFAAYATMNTYFTEYALISYIYPNSEKGLYPDGTRFNIFDFTSVELLQKTVEDYNAVSGKKLVSPDDLADKIVISEYLSGSVMEKVQAARNKGEDYSYFANEYVVEFQPVRKMDFSAPERLFGLIPALNSRSFLDTLYENYTYYFMNDHTEMNIIPRINERIRYDDYDYIEIADVFEKRITMYINYLETKKYENGGFVSGETNMTFDDLIAEFQTLKSVGIQNLKSFVSSSKLAKNPETLVNKLRAQNEKNYVNFNKLDGESYVAKIAMLEYDHTFEENIVIAGINEEIGLYQARPQTAYDLITKRSLDKGVEAQNLLKDLEENDRLIEAYSSSDMTEQERERLSAIADGMITQIEEQNTRLTELANQTVDDYLVDKCSNYVRFASLPKSYFSIALLIKCGILFILGIIVMLALLLLIDRKHFSSLIKNTPEENKLAGNDKMQLRDISKKVDKILSK